MNPLGTKNAYFLVGALLFWYIAVAFSIPSYSRQAIGGYKLQIYQ
jgi:hypothetical protein